MFRAKVKVLFTMIFVVSMFPGCDDMLPDIYKAESLDTDMATLDLRACELITQPLIRHDTTFVDTGNPDSLVIDEITHDTLYIALGAAGNGFTANFDAMLLDSAQVRDVIDFLQVTDIDSSILDTMQAAYLIGAVLPNTLMWDEIDTLLTATFSDSVLDSFQADELIDTLLTFIDLGNLIYAHLSATLGDSLLSIWQLDDLFESLYTTTYDSIATLADILVADSSVDLSHPNSGEPSYLLYATGSGGSAELVIYTDEYVDVELVESPGTVIPASAVNMETALIAGCSVGVTNSQTNLEEPMPAVKSRHVLVSNSGAFLVRITIPEMDTNRKIRLALIEN